MRNYKIKNKVNALNVPSASMTTGSKVLDIGSIVHIEDWGCFKNTLENKTYLPVSIDNAIKWVDEKCLEAAYYRVRKSWKDASSQKGAFELLDKAKECADQNKGYYIFDANGIAVYPVPYIVSVENNIYIYSDAKVQTSKAITGKYTIIKVESNFGKLKSGEGWIKLDGLDVSGVTETVATSKSYIEKAAQAADKVYKAVVDNHCVHKSGTKTFDEIAKKKAINCSSSMSIVLQLAGCLKTGEIVNHRSASGLNGSALINKKSTKSSAMSGYDDLISGTCDIIRVDKLYKDLNDKCKQKGVGYIYDSDCAISAGNNKIYSCNEGKSQMKNGKYTDVTASSGYCFTHTILYAIVPKG